MLRKLWIFGLLIVFLLGGVACEFCWITDCDDDEDNFPCENCDLQLTGLLTAYNQKDYRYLECCLSDDFKFYFDPVDSADVANTFPDMTLDRDRELSITRSMIENADIIELELYGDSVEDYSGDPNGVAKILRRGFDLTVIFADSSGYDISGNCNFIVRPEGDQYKIVEWWDLSAAQPAHGLRDVENGRSWGYVKWIFR